jgi:hypothetical protein
MYNNQCQVMNKILSSELQLQHRTEIEKTLTQHDMVYMIIWHVDMQIHGTENESEILKSFLFHVVCFCVFVIATHLLHFHKLSYVSLNNHICVISITHLKEEA